MTMSTLPLSYKYKLTFEAASTALFIVVDLLPPRDMLKHHKNTKVLILT